LKVLAKAIENDDFRERLITIFNDKDEENVSSLKEAIQTLPGIEILRYEPQLFCEEVGEEIVAMFEGMRLVPTLFFVDPWGYKGLSLRLVNSVLKDWGCDAIFFFNYNRINMGMNNDAVREHMEALFGPERFSGLREELEGRSPSDRELLIVEEICASLKEYGTTYVLPFCFKNSNGRRTSHHLIFASKNFRGYDIMKEIMARESTGNDDGVPSFEYNPADFLPKQALLFKLSRPLEGLKADLLSTFRGKTLEMKTIYEKHSVDTPFVKKNYKGALRELFDEGKIEAVSPTGKPPRKGTFAEKVLVTFPG
jgi:three-Cys-motif partner protein